jgi:5-methylcytosine-specific restriction endonuclease McrA
MINNEKTFTKEEITLAISKTPTMGAAAKFLKVDCRTFKKEADRYGLYKPSQSKGKKYELDDILNGKHPQYPTSKLSKRLVSEGYKEYKCELCGIVEWNGNSISLELNHIDGDSSNHSLDNLELICPNCHSQTDTYRSKNVLKRRLAKETKT